MSYKKSVFACIISILLYCHSPIALAAPPADQLNRYLSQIGWTKQDLQDYLNYYELPLDQFNSVADLQSILGTPIDARNYQNLLARYNLTDQQLKSLLNHFSDSLDQYKFIEDLDTSVSFYLGHKDLMTQIKTKLAQTGITEGEVDRFFSYLGQLEENNKSRLDQLQALDIRIENFINQMGPGLPTHAQINELTQILSKAANLYEINIKFKVNNKSISLNQLLNMKTVPGNLYTAIYSKSARLLIDFTIPADFFEGLVSGWEDMLHLGELANELVDFLHEQKVNNFFK